MERKLIPLTISNAMGNNNQSGVYKPLGLKSSQQQDRLQLFPDMPKVSDVRSEMHRRMQADHQSASAGGTKLLAEPPPLSELQRQMFSDQPGKELYKKTESGK